jgi:NitT/TauT family transport system substrate-binding protein
LYDDNRLSSLTRRAFVGRAAGAVAATSGLTTLVAACGGDDDEQSSGGGSKSGKTEEVIFLNIVPLDLSFCCEILAEINGYFKNEGLRVKFQSTRGSAPALQALISGSALMARAGAIEMIRAVADKGAPLLNVGTQMHASTLTFVSTREKPLTKPEDWRGKRMGIPSEGGTSENVLDLVLAAGNVPLDSVERQVVGLTPGTFEIVKQGRVAGYVVGTVNSVIFEQQRPEAYLFDTNKYVKDAQVYMVSQQASREKRDVIQGYMSAIKRASDEVLSDRDKKFATTLKTIRGKHEFPELESDDLAVGVMEKVVGTWVAEGEENVLKTVPETWKQTYEQLIPVELVEPGKDPQKWFTNDFVT